MLGSIRSSSLNKTQVTMATQTNGVHNPLRVVVFDNMRNRSHIFSRLWSLHDAVSQIWHPYVTTAFVGPDRIVARLRHSEERQREVMVDWEQLFVPETYGKSTKILEEKVAAIERAVGVPSIVRQL